MLLEAKLTSCSAGEREVQPDTDIITDTDTYTRQDTRQTATGKPPLMRQLVIISCEAILVIVDPLCVCVGTCVYVCVCV